MTSAPQAARRLQTLVLMYAVLGLSVLAVAEVVGMLLLGDWAGARITLLLTAAADLGAAIVFALHVRRRH